MKYFNIKILKIYFITLLNLVKIYLLIKKKHRKNRKLKVLIFYFPLKAYNENLMELISILKKNTNFLVLLIRNKYSEYSQVKQKHSYLLDFNFLRFIPFSNNFLSKIDLFISAYAVYIFPPNSKNIFISHDITDAPMVNKEIEKKIFLSFFSKIHFIFLPSNTTIKYFLKKIQLFLVNNKLKAPKIINTGYLKLDHVRKKLDFINCKKDSILIAPTASHMLKIFNISNDLINIIDNLLNKTKNKIIFRPHPLDLIRNENINYVNKIADKFKGYKNFTIDSSISYLESYSKAKLLVTDFSGTAYTFAFSTLNPIIFYSRNEEKFKKTKYSNLSYFKDRLQIGYISRNVTHLTNLINKPNLINKKMRNKIFSLRKKRIKYLGKSLKKTHEEILNILDKKNNFYKN
jgi:hypothetical protein|tara:strand:+ start:218 stop:1426 length:1209 start_codon:yes stop_codon:yes gene_type:complete